MHWGSEVKWPPDRSSVMVPRNRCLGPDTGCHVVYADLRPEEVTSRVTAPLRTVIDCGRRLPFDEALAVADSALRHGDVTGPELVAAAADVRGKGAARCRRVASAADGRAANPFESVLRGIGSDVRGLALEPQVPVRTRIGIVHPDLVDQRRRIAVEADSWTWHTGRDAHSRDCVRYTALVLAGWSVVRFTWEQVMLSPAYVRSVLTELARLAA